MCLLLLYLHHTYVFIGQKHSCDFAVKSFPVCSVLNVQVCCLSCEWCECVWNHVELWVWRHHFGLWLFFQSFDKANDQWTDVENSQQIHPEWKESVAVWYKIVQSELQLNKQKENPVLKWMQESTCVFGLPEPFHSSKNLPFYCTHIAGTVNNYSS